jgi:hypothetical protein
MACAAIFSWSRAIGIKMINACGVPAAEKSVSQHPQAEGSFGIAFIKFNAAHMHTLADSSPPFALAIHSR